MRHGILRRVSTTWKIPPKNVISARGAVSERWLFCYLVLPAGCWAHSFIPGCCGAHTAPGAASVVPSFNPALGWGAEAEILRSAFGANLQLHFHSHGFLTLSLILGDSRAVDGKGNFTDCQHLLCLTQDRNSSPSCLGEMEERERQLWVYLNYLINFILILRLLYNLNILWVYFYDLYNTRLKVDISTYHGGRYLEYMLT